MAVLVRWRVLFVSVTNNVWAGFPDTAEAWSRTKHVFSGDRRDGSTRFLVGFVYIQLKVLYKQKYFKENTVFFQ